jgi:hypothetical protein
MPSPRNKGLMFVEELVDLHLRNLHICIASRSEVNITIALNSNSLHSHIVDLHEEDGQKQDIINYLNWVVNLDSK